jgi:non-canonical (house-cleaning) NTP pyrophosphatase
MTVVTDAGLRDEGKDELVDGIQTNNEARDARKDLPPHKREQPIGINQQIEHAIRGLQQTLRDFDSLFVVGIENLWISCATQDERELPCQVVTILDAGVHALRACR